jgi:hypothetical protein
VIPHREERASEREMLVRCVVCFVVRWRASALQEATSQKKKEMRI